MLPPELIHTVESNPHLFKIVTLIKVNAFRDLLKHHPNKRLVSSACRGLQEGFWPWATYPLSDYPLTNDEAQELFHDPVHQDILREKVQGEVRAGRYSESFGPLLLPGMYNMPVWIVHRNEKPRLICDQSAGNFSPNSMIPKHERTLFLDTIQSYGRAIRRAKHAQPDRAVILVKSDVARGYRNMPVHPYFQALQIVKCDDHRYVDRCAEIGGAGSGRIFVTFMALVLWIALYVKHILDLFSYVDDIFSYDYEGNLIYYEPYHKLMPTKQVRLLMLWDELGIPHEEKKQLWGRKLVVIGFEIDTDAMTITMPKDSKDKFVQHIHTFLGSTKIGKRRSLREFQQMAGYCNWALNVAPLLRPGLASLYAKMRGKTNFHALVRLNESVIRDLTWFARHFQSSSGIFILDAIAWNLEEADMVMYSDASLTGLGFWSPTATAAFHHKFQESIPQSLIYFYEALSVCCALRWASTLVRTPHRLVIYTDNQNTVDMFNSFKAEPLYNPLLQFA
ncbi:DNA/RNA polymerase, partial [Rickenella mellea]